VTAPAGPNPDAVGRIAAEHLGPILYALETCALTMERAGRDEEVRYFRALAQLLAEAGGATPPAGNAPPSTG
jgi:hypothetical protein